MTSKILLIGGEGFIGRNISNTLSENYNCFSIGIEKSIFLNRKDKYIFSNPYKEIISNTYDVYIHLIDNKVKDDTFEVEEIKLLNNLHIQPNSHLILFSSSVIYANPSSPYAKRKLALENIYENYCQKNNINLSTLRLFNIFGNYQLPNRQGSLIANIFYNHLNNLPIEINDMEVKRDYIYAKDMANIVKQIIEDKIYEKGDLASGKQISIRELINLIEEKVIFKRLNIIDKNIKETNICPKAKELLNYKLPQTSFIDALNQTLTFYKVNRDIIEQYLYNRQ